MIGSLLMLALATSRQNLTIVWGAQDLVVHETQALCYRIEYNLNGGYVPSDAITPIAAMPTEHPAVKQPLCGNRLLPGDKIPIKGAGLFNNDLSCGELSGAEVRPKSGAALPRILEQQTARRRVQEAEAERRWRHTHTSRPARPSLSLM